MRRKQPSAAVSIGIGAHRLHLWSTGGKGLNVPRLQTITAYLAQSFAILAGRAGQPLACIWPCKLVLGGC